MKHALSDFAESIDVVMLALEEAVDFTSDPRLGSICRALAEQMGNLEGSATFAVRVGFRSRYQLDRTLKRHGLPPLEHLAAWTRLLTLLARAEARGVSLDAHAWSIAKEPTTFHRLCHHLAGERWTQLRDAGLAHAIMVMKGECATRRTAHTRQHGMEKRDNVQRVG